MLIRNPQHWNPNRKHKTILPNDYVWQIQKLLALCVEWKAIVCPRYAH